MDRLCDWKKTGNNTYVCPQCQATRQNARKKKCLATCQHLGPIRTTGGIAQKVKCNCNGKTSEVYHDVYQCDVHGRCLPTLQLVGEQLETWGQRQPESALYHLCGASCGEFEAKELT